MILYIWKLEDGAFNNVTVIDDASSVIWVQRLNEIGEFEIYIRASAERLKLFNEGDVFITRPDSEIAMYVEMVKLDTNEETGDYLTVSGRSAEVILSWRVVQFQMFAGSSETVENIIRFLFVQKFITAGVGQISWLSIEEAHGWEEGTTHQYTGRSLEEIFNSLCVTYDYGFKLKWLGNGFEFQLYKGTDRSFDQNVNTYVVFSPEFENLGNTEYIKNTSEYANAAVIGGEGEGSERVFVSIAEQGKSGFYFRQVYLDARNSSQEELSLDAYKEQLANDGKDQLEQLRVTAEYTGEVLNYNQYVYGVDYFLGDKVSTKNEYGIKGNAVVTEITEVEDESGYKLVPTLSEWTPASYEED